MSYNLFLLLNTNHEKEPLLDYIGKQLEQTGPQSFCLDQSPDIFFSVEYLQEGLDTSLCIDIPFGADEDVLKEVLNFMTYLQETIQFQVLDPQIGRILEPDQTRLIIDAWKNANLQALENYGDGHHFLRNVEIRDEKKAMIEAIRYKEETWQNHCSVALAYGRVRDAANSLKYFRKAFDLDPENTAILHAIGVAHFNLQQYAEAKKVLAHYLEYDPENETALELIQACDSKLQSS
jgi:tetratricopeptide (TPR) repeat protein